MDDASVFAAISFALLEQMYSTVPSITQVMLPSFASDAS
jgi:hypothetical protein